MTSIFPTRSAWGQEEERQRFAREAVEREVERPPEHNPHDHTHAFKQARHEVTASRDDIDFVVDRIEDALVRITQQDSGRAGTELYEALEVLRRL